MFSVRTKKRFLLAITSLFFSMGASAQGNNTLMGGNDAGFESIAERITKLEKRHDAFNIYVNFAGSVKSEHSCVSSSKAPSTTSSSTVCATVLTSRRRDRALTTSPRLPTS